MAIVRAISAQYRRFGHLQGITASTVRVLTPETAATNDKRAKIARILCIMVFAHINYRALQLQNIPWW